MFSIHSNCKLPGTGHLSEAAFARPSLSAPHAMALTSKQRAIGVDLLQTVARLLRSVGPRLEAAALQEAMQDVEATEFVSAAMAQAEASASNESTMTGSVSGVPSISFFNVESGESLLAASQHSASDGTLATLQLAAVLRTRPAASTVDGHSTREHDISDASAGSTVRTRPRYLSIVCDDDDDESSATEVPSVTRSPYSRSASTHSRKSSTRLLSKGTTAAQTEHSENQPYRFPADWFATSAVERLARPHPLASSVTTVVDRCEQRTDVPPRFDTPEDRPVSHGTPSQRTATSAAPSATDSTESYASLPTTGFMEAEAAADATQTLPPPVSTTTPSSTVIKSPPLQPQPQRCPPPLPLPPFPTPRDVATDKKLNSLTSHFSPLLTQASGMSGYGAGDDRAMATTAQPPLFVDNMLLDPATGCFLFGGHAFREEARVLYVPSSMPLQPDATTTTTSGGSGGSSAATTATAAAAALRAHLLGPASATIAPSSNTARGDGSSLLLVREYFPLFSVSSAGGGDGGRGLMSIDASAAPPDDVMVQCFSLLPPWMTQVQPNRYHLLSEAVAIACVCQALPGCVSIVTPLSRLLRGGRYFSLTAGSQSSQQASTHINTFFAFGGMHRLPTEGNDGTALLPQPHASSSPLRGSGSPDPQHRAPVQPFNYMGALAGGGGFAGRQSLALSIDASAPLHVDGKEEAIEAARIVAVAERLSAVPPDVLDEALAAVRHSLAFYSDYAERRQRMRNVLLAVRVLQRFFRRCLAVKRRAVRRMVRVWRTLEVEARAKLQQHRALPSAVERIDAVANTILQEHMLTSLDYKRKFIRDEWARRRAAFARWKEEEEWNAVFAEEQQARLDKYANNTTSSSNDADSCKDPMAATATLDGSRVEVLSSPVAPSRPRTARLTAEEAQRMADAFERRRQPPSKPLPFSTPLLLHTTAPAVSAFPAGGATATSVTPLLSLADVQTQQHEAVMRRFCSWYMDPHELLFLSHQRLLETLKGTVLRMEEVQSELSRAAAEVMRDAGASGG